ncbi:MAG: UDP-N-acetylmuramoyl-tripeptide--D-alanyl-D-alanine ligase, partial [Candidatus Zixiibacteriota bacterium]
VEQTAYRSHGNLNNLFGAPLALLGMPQDTKVAAIEMGISTKGEMTRLAQIVGPDVAVITNIGPSHLEFLSTVEDVAHAKLEIVSASPDRPLVINADDRLLIQEAKKVSTKIVTFGIDHNADFNPTLIEPTDTGSRVTIGSDSFSIDLFGRHPVYNLLAAYAACKTLGYDYSKIDCSTIRLTAATMRGELIEKNGMKIINDAYNANPESMNAGLEAFKATPVSGRRILILGDMLELGVRSEKFHRELGNSLVRYEFACAIVVGEWSRAVLESARQAGVSSGKLRSFKNSDEAAFGISEIIKPGDVVYVKGSRGVRLEKIIEKIGSGGEKR